MSLVSVIIPVYNRENVLEECVQSVLTQHFQDFEILLVDDGSSDRTTDICQKLALQNARIKFHAAQHGGVSAARNIALELACGKYVFFLDSDDVIHPRLLETLADAMEKTGAQIGGSGIVSVAETNWQRVQQKLQEPSLPGETTFHTHEETMHALFHGNSPLGCIGGVIMRRDLIGDTKFRTDLYIGEDYFFIYENLIKGAEAVFLTQRWYYVRHHRHNSSWDFSYNGFWTRFFRRKLVWEMEETFGRPEYAAIQKRDAVGCFTNCVARNKPYSEDSKKMRAVIKEHRAVLFPALGVKSKISLFVALYTPFLYPAFRRTIHILKSFRKRFH